MTNIGAPEAILALFGVIMLAMVIWAVVDVLRRPTWAFEAAGVSRTFWLLALLVGIFVCGIGFFVAIAYLLIASPKVKAQEKVGRIGFPGTGSNFPT